MVTWVVSPNFHVQTGIAKKFIVPHWIVGTLESADVRFKDWSAQVSAHYGIQLTVCPGSLDLKLIVNRANTLMK